MHGHVLPFDHHGSLCKTNFVFFVTGSSVSDSTVIWSTVMSLNISL